MSVVFSDSWQGLVNTYVERYTGTLKQLTTQQIGWSFVTEVLERYIAAAEKAMGSKTARGGYPVIDFQGVSPEPWKPLSIWTVAAKNGIDTEELMGDPSAQEILKAAWDTYADSTPIWEDSGRGKSSLRVDESIGAVVANGYLETVEKGGPGSWGGEATVPARPLFAVLNEGFLNYIRGEIRNKRSTMYKNIRREVKAKGLWK